jgi:LysR family glycine cleavage system transcriptional activator
MNWLRPFEATARLGSTVLAAKELGRTHGAVSRQIRLLEEWLQVALFSREGGRLVVTAFGEDYFRAVTRTFRLLEAAALTLDAQENENRIRILCPPVFASRWLLPRMEEFFAEHPDFEVCIRSCADDVAPEPGQFDLAILMAPGEWPDVDVTPLMPDILVPVTTGLHDALALIRTKDPLATWQRWFETVRGCRLAARKFIDIEDTEAAFRAAARGYGIALARGQLVLDDILDGRLESPIRSAVQIDTGYWLLKPHVGFPNPAIKTFISKLRTECILAFERLKRQVSSQVDQFHFVDARHAPIQPQADSELV